METEHSVDDSFKYLFKNLDDAAVKFKLTDEGPVIIDANDAFIRTFGDESTPVIGEALNDLIVPPTEHDEARQFDQRTRDGESNTAVVERMTGAGKRKFVYRGIPLGEQFGFAVYSDVTEEIQRKHHLEVLHRVMRHNLRNDLTVIFGMAQDIIENTENEQTEATAKKIRQTAHDLEQLSDEANTIEGVLEESVTVEPIELNPLMDSVIASYEHRVNTNATIINEIPTNLVADADNRLETVLRSLLDNAIRHNDSPTPRVTITGTETDASTVRLEVTDNGPGIPDAEKQLVTDYQQVSKVNHNSGLGLWLAKLTVDSYDGRIDIETPDDGGTTVSIWLNKTG